MCIHKTYIIFYFIYYKTQKKINFFYFKNLTREPTTSHIKKSFVTDYFKLTNKQTQSREINFYKSILSNHIHAEYTSKTKTWNSVHKLSYYQQVIKGYALLEILGFIFDSFAVFSHSKIRQLIVVSNACLFFLVYDYDIK